MLQRSPALLARPGSASRVRDFASRYQHTALKYPQLFLPFLVAELLAFTPTASYLTAWAGSLGILYVTITGKIKPLPTDRPLARQILRPILFTQVIFVSYTALTSIFHFAAQQGYYYLQYNAAQAASMQQLALLAEAQRYYVLAHAALVTGMLLAMNYRSSGRWQLNVSPSSPPKLMLAITAGTLAASSLLALVPGLSQIVGRLSTISLVASILSLALALPSRNLGLIALNLVLYGLNFFQALLSGWKQEVIVMLVLLGLFAYPYYRRTVTAVVPAGLFLLLAFLPTYNHTFRSLSWRGEMESTRAAAVAYETVTTADAQTLQQNTWRFLTGRASEIGMFTAYLRRMPEGHPFYGMQLVQQSAENMVPRALWSAKPNTEERVMERVYDHHVVSRASNVSAKPHFVVDSYLSAGALGVLGFGLLYGLLASWASRLAERWFGGYLVGTGLVYTALFQVMWTSNAFEFFFSAVLWSFTIMGGLFMLGRYFDLLVPAPSTEGTP